MIEILEIRNADRKLVGVVDDAKSVIWACEYYGAGSFEVYAVMTDQNKSLLQIGNLITRRNEINVAIIERVEYTNSVQDGAMIVASGRMLKSILDRRVVYNPSTVAGNNTNPPTIIRGNVATAVQSVVNTNAGAGAIAARQMGVIIGSTGGITKTITTSEGEATARQTTFGGLLEFTDEVLQEYECGALIRLDNQLQMVYDCFEGKDRSVGNTAGNTPLTFSQDFDNLISSDYTNDNSTLKTAALIGGQGEGLDRKYTFVDTTAATGMSRREMWVDGSNVTETTDVDYISALTAQAAAQLKAQAATETFTGEINLTYSPYKYGYDADFWLGDIVTIQDNALGLYINVRILKATEVQDDSGYTLSVEYGN